MTLSNSNKFAAAFASIVCTIITFGASIAATAPYFA
jgi:hypothetical protein